MKGKKVVDLSDLEAKLEQMCIRLTAKKSFVDDLLTEKDKPNETLADSSDDA